MKIISYNVNGIRSAINKGLKEFIYNENPDIVCIQEAKLPIGYEDSFIDIEGYDYAINYSSKNGYSGVICYYKQQPVNIIKTINNDRFDSEGRVLILDYDDYIIINVYMPQGGRKKENLEYKLDTFKSLNTLLKKYINKKVILIGDLNIAHTFEDVENAKNNINNIMFTVEERYKISEIIDSGFVDTFRIFNKNKGSYSWFPYAYNAKERNIGWRIDYCFVSKNIAEKVGNSIIKKEIQCSDHCPIIIEIEDSLG